MQLIPMVNKLQEVLAVLGSDLDLPQIVRTPAPPLLLVVALTHDSRMAARVPRSSSARRAAARAACSRTSSATTSCLAAPVRRRRRRHDAPRASLERLTWLCARAGIVTRRPLILQLNKTESGGVWGEFAHLPHERFTDFGAIRDEISRVRPMPNAQCPMPNAQCLAAAATAAQCLVANPGSPALLVV